MTRRVAAIVRADFLIRFRRLSTLVVFLLLSALAYVWVPDPSTGRALMQIGGRRVVYDSAALGLATAMLASLFVGLIGFYVVSNAIRRDVDTRCGSIIAATGVRTIEYLAGKLLGNVVFLVTFIGGFMVASMAMQLVRGEAALQPLVFLWHYALMVSGTIVFVSVLSLVFECVPWLSGRFGDVVYFFFWAASFGAVASSMEQGARWPRYFDSTSLGYLLVQMRAHFQTNSVQIGASKFDAARGLAHVPVMPIGELLPRITSVFWPLALLPFALVFFHRFDPARTRAASAKSGRTWIGRINAIAKPLARPLFGAAGRGRIASDAMLTFTLMPVSAIALAVAFAFGIGARGALPMAMAISGIFVADIASRDRSAGTIGLVYAAPALRERFVFWKLASSSVVALLFAGGAIVRAVFASPAALPGLLVATLFVAATATSLGVISANPKTFIVLFLSFWYVAVNDKGETPLLDFAGFYRTPGPPVLLLYGALSVLFVVAAEAMHRLREAA